MKRNAYDKVLATRLVPMLRSIMHETLQRTAAIEELEARLETLSNRRSVKLDLQEISATQAALATHRRELRRTQLELSRIGCALDDDHPLRILIPGEGGDIHHGFAWNARDESLLAIPSESAS